MFGYVKVNADELKVSDYRLYKSIYCGLCKTMKSEIGLSSTLSLSYDFVFLSILIADVSGEGFDIRMGRCGLHPFKKRPVAKKNNALRYASGASAVLKYYKLLDDISDSGFLKRTAVRFLLPSAKRHFKRAKKSLTEFNLDKLAMEVKARLDELTALEKSGSPSCERNADVFGKLLSSVFENYFHDKAFAPAAKELGYCVGAFIYIADALDDFEKDIEKGRYNPFSSAGFDEIPTDSVTATLCKLNERAETALSALPSEFEDLRRISENIIKLGLRMSLKKNQRS